jgi:hypothetical protein
MQIDIRTMNEFLKFVFIRSLMNWEKENKKKLLSKNDIIDMKFIVNNEELNIVDIFKSYEENMDLYIKIEARKLIEERFDDIEYDMDNIIYKTLEETKIKMMEKLDEKENENDD